MNPRELKSKVLAGLGPPGGSRGDSDSLSFLAFRDHLHCLAPGPPPPPSKCITSTSVSVVLPPPFLMVFPPFYKDPYDYITPSRIIQDHHHVAKSLI